MPRVGRYRNPTINVDWLPDALPPGVDVRPVVLPTPDRASTSGVLYAPEGSSDHVVAIMHPRVDCTHHYLIPGLLRAGYAVWAQRSRWVGNDLRLIHERVLIDVAVAHEHLRGQGFESVFLLGNSGGASLYAFYTQQAALQPEARLTDDPSGNGIDLTLPMPMPRGVILLAPHPGQGELLMHCIDPSVVDEHDGASVELSLDMYDPNNGFAEPPASSSYTPEFLDRYRTAQRERVARIDARAKAMIAERKAHRARSKTSGDVADRRRSLVPDYLVTYRTDADPRTTDLSLDPSDRNYGSIFGVRPDIINYGGTGFGRLTTPEAWLSTWSGLSSRAMLRLTAPDIAVPSLVIWYSADNSVFPADVAAVVESLGSKDKTYVDVKGDHYGYAPGTEERSGATAALEAVVDWLAGRA